jgi:hypothetical protein
LFDFREHEHQAPPDIDRPATDRPVRAKPGRNQSGGNASYNGLLLGLRKRAAKGITIDTNYTWSHCIGAYQANEAGDTGANPDLPQPFPGNRDARVGNCLADLRHVFNLSSVLETPRFANNTLRHVASGWRLSPLYRYHTGTFINVIAGGNNDFARNGTNINNQPAVYQGAIRSATTRRSNTFG